MRNVILPLLLTFILYSSHAWGTVNEIVVLKLKELKQTGPSTVGANPGAAFPFQFEAFIEEEQTGDLLTSATISPPGGSVSSINFIFNSPDEWEAADGAADETALDAKLNDGTFTFNVNFTSAGAQSSQLDLTGTFFGTDPQINSLTNAAWVNNELEIDKNDFATIGFTSDSGFSDGNDFMAVYIQDSMGNEVDLSSMTAFSSFTIGSGGDFELSPGTYNMEIEVVDVTDFSPTNNFGNPSILGAAGYSTITTVDLIIIPEPGTYALGLGGLSLLGAFLFRRIRAKKA
jgi:hypothetical protein